MTCCQDVGRHPNSRFTTTLADVPDIADDVGKPAGVPVNAIIFGGRTRDRQPLRAITDLRAGAVTGDSTPGRDHPTRDEPESAGLELPAEDVDRLLAIDVARWQPELGHRERHLARFAGRPEEIWPAHRRIVADPNA